MTGPHCNSLNKCDRDYGFPQRLLIFNWWQLAQTRLPVDGPSSRQGLSKRLQCPLGNRAIWTSGCRIQGVSKVVCPCKRRRNSQPLEVSWRGMTKQYMWVLLGNFSRISQRNIQWAGGRRSHRTSHLSYVSQWAAFIWYVTKGRQITENPVHRRRPCQKRQLVDVIGDQGDECWKLIQKKAYGIR